MFTLTFTFTFKDTHMEKAPSNKTQTLSKSMNTVWTFRRLVHQINSLYEILKLKQNFRKIKVVAAKTLFFVIGPFVFPILLVLALAPDRAVLYGNFGFQF